MIKVVPLLFLFSGLFLLFQISLPIISFNIWENALPKNISLTTPLSTKDSQVLGVSIENVDNFPQFISTAKRQVDLNFSVMELRVPALDIEDQLVTVDSNDLSSGLIHLPGSALPGEKGNVFISGHSSLPILSKSKKAPFANLNKLQKNDTIKISAAGVNFEYIVKDIKVVPPSDLSVINPPDNQGRYLTLMTCVPPGLNTKRLIVLGELI